MTKKNYRQPYRGLLTVTILSILNLTHALIPVSSSFALPRIIVDGVRPTSKNQLYSHRVPVDETQEDLMLLPIFPLRKRVKFPTQTNQLTLWEERYKNLAQCILNSKSSEQMFGVLYCSDKAQMVKKGTEPVTPIIKVGDTGVMNILQESQIFPSEGDGSNNVSEKGLNHIQKIRLLGLGVGRFKVEKILHNGFGGGDAVLENKEDPLPFILVKASRIDDIRIEEDQISDIENRIEKMCPLPASKGDFLPSTQGSYSWSFARGTTLEQQRQLWSFAMVSSLVDTASTVDMQRMLETTSTLERFEFLDRAFNERENPFNIFTSLFQNKD
jgi:hypothetical protein